MKKTLALLVSLLLIVSITMPAYADAGKFDADALKGSSLYSYNSDENTWKIVGSCYKEYSDGDIEILLCLFSDTVEKGWGPELRAFSYDSINSYYEKVVSFSITVDDKIYSFSNLDEYSSGSILGGTAFGGEIMRTCMNSLADARLVQFKIDCVSGSGESYFYTVGPVERNDIKDLIEMAALFEEANLWDPDVTTDIDVNDEYYAASVSENEEFDESLYTTDSNSESAISSDADVSSADDGSAVSADDTGYDRERYVSILDVAKPDRTDIVLFGSYEQDGNLDNGPEPIKWLVLESDGRVVTMISLYALDAIPYQEGYVDVTWETCELRSWMNDTFLNEAFTEEEKAVILPVTSDNNNNYESSTMWRTIKAGNDTEDRVFALSCMQAESLFGHRRGYSGGSNQTFLQWEGVCKPTDYAKAQGLSTDEHGNCYWWLRSPAVNTYYASYVSPMGTEGATHIYAHHIGVRPAVKIDFASIGSKVENTSISRNGVLEVEDFRFEYSEFMREYKVYFTVKNLSDITLEGVYVRASFMDSNGTVVYNNLTSESTIRKGQSAVLNGWCDVAYAPDSVFVDSYGLTIDGQLYKDYVDDPYIYEIR